jgi:RNA polymerase-binding protein DksA
MTKKELKKFEQLLLAERERILRGIAGLRGEVLYQPLSDRPMADPNAAADVGTDSFERETALRVYGNEAKELEEIDDALDRIQRGNFGVCEGTGKPIPKKRLEVFPAARYCVEYQAELEKTGKQEENYDYNYQVTLREL